MSKPNAPFVYEPNKNPGCVRSPEDWQLREPKCFVRHLPTHAIFRFEPLPEKQPGDFLGLQDFRAWLVHVCDGHPYPSPAEHTRLCAEAVVMGLHFLGFLDLVEIADDEAEMPF